LSTSVNIHAAAEQIAAETFVRPTPEEIEAIAVRWQDAKQHLAEARGLFESIENEAIAMVTEYGIVVPRAEKSRRLTGGRAELTVTKSDTLTISDERVETLKEALEANGYGEFFKRLFALRSKYEVVEGAEAALKAESLPKRLAEKVLNLWGRCISVKPKKPALKVNLFDPAKPAKRSKKAGAQ
jgi:hypothetical protein